MKVFPSKLEMTAEPGTSQEFDISVRNFRPVEELLTVYFMDYYINPDNQFVFEEPGHYSYSCASWLSTETPVFVAPAGERKATKRFKLTVPHDAEPGGHYGIIFFEQVLPEDTGEIVTMNARIGAVILVTVPGEIVREGVIESVSVTSTWFWPARKILGLPESRTRYRVVFHNKGNVHLTVKGTLTYTPTFGWGAGAVDLGEITVLPKTERYLEETIPGPPLLGSYKVQAEVLYGPSLYEFDTTKTKTSTFNSYPLSLLLIPLALATLIIVIVWLLKRKFGKKARAKKKEGKEESEGEKEEEGKKEPQPEERWAELLEEAEEEEEVKPEGEEGDSDDAGDEGDEAAEESESEDKKEEKEESPEEENSGDGGEREDAGDAEIEEPEEEEKPRKRGSGKRKGRRLFKGKQK